MKTYKLRPTNNKVVSKDQFFPVPSKTKQDTAREPTPFKKLRMSLKIDVVDLNFLDLLTHRLPFETFGNLERVVRL